MPHSPAARYFGWALLVLGAMVFSRAAWLGALYFGAMGELSRLRTFVALGAGAGMLALGVWLIVRRSS